MNKNLKVYLLNNLSSVFYSVAIVIGIFIATQELYIFGNSSNFLIFSVAIFFIYCVDIFTAYRSKSNRVELNLDINDDINELSQLFHKIILPIGLYLSIIGFSYFNYSNTLFFIVLLITFVIFYILLINTRAFLQHKLTAEHKTHYIYDIIKFLIFFLLINTISNLYRSIDTALLPVAILVLLICWFIFILMLWRIEKLRKKTIFYSGIAAMVLGVFFVILHLYTALNPIQTSLSIFFLFYIFNALIHHKLMGTLTKGVIGEYAIVVGLVLSITYGIT